MAGEIPEIVVTAPRYTIGERFSNFLFGAAPKPAPAPRPRPRPPRRAPPGQPRRRRSPPRRAPPPKPEERPKVPNRPIPKPKPKIPKPEKLKPIARPKPRGTFIARQQPRPGLPTGMGAGRGGLVFEIVGGQVAAAFAQSVNEDFLRNQALTEATKGPQNSRAQRIETPPAVLSPSELQQLQKGPETRPKVSEQPEQVFAKPVPRAPPRTADPFPELSAPPLAKIADILGVKPPQPIKSPPKTANQLLGQLFPANAQPQPKLQLQAALKEARPIIAQGVRSFAGRNPLSEERNCRVVCSDSRKNKGRKPKKGKKSKKKKKVCLTAKDIKKAGLKTAFAKLGLTPS